MSDTFVMWVMIAECIYLVVSIVADIVRGFSGKVYFCNSFFKKAAFVPLESMLTLGLALIVTQLIFIFLTNRMVRNVIWTLLFYFVSCLAVWISAKCFNRWGIEKLEKVVVKSVFNPDGLLRVDICHALERGGKLYAVVCIGYAEDEQVLVMYRPVADKKDKQDSNVSNVNAHWLSDRQLTIDGKIYKFTIKHPGEQK